MATSRKYPKWTAARRKKFMATVRARGSARADAGKKFYRRGMLAAISPEGAKAPRGHNHRDAIVFLRHGREDVVRRMKEGSLKSLDTAHLYMMLALATLTGEA